MEFLSGVESMSEASNNDEPNSLSSFAPLIVGGLLAFALAFVGFAATQYCTTENNCTLTDCPQSCLNVDIALRTSLGVMVLVSVVGYWVVRRIRTPKIVTGVQVAVFLVCTVWIVDLGTQVSSSLAIESLPVVVAAILPGRPKSV